MLSKLHEITQKITVNRSSLYKIKGYYAIFVRQIEMNAMLFSISVCGHGHRAAHSGIVVFKLIDRKRVQVLVFISREGARER